MRSKHFFTEPRILYLSFLAAAAVFAIDWLTPLAFSGGVMYLLAMLIAMQSNNPRFIVVFAGICSALTVAGVTFHSPEVEFERIYIMRFLGLLAIWSTTIISMQYKGMVKHWYTEIDEKIKAQKRLNENQELIQAIIDNTPSIIYVKDMRGKYISINRQYEKEFGISRDAMIGKTDYDLFPEETAGLFSANDKKAISGKKPIECEEIVSKNDGEKHVHLSVKFPLLDNSGEPYALCGISTDITERKKIEEELKMANKDLAMNERSLRIMVKDLKKVHEGLKKAKIQLIQAEKLKVIGRLASGVAHEVKNPLAIILQGVEYLSKKVPEDDKNMRTVLGDIDNAVHRADTVIRGLLNYSRVSQVDRELKDINAIIETAFILVKHELEKNHIEFVKEAVNDIPQVNVDATKIEQILVNLLLNAIHATPDGGKITVRTALQEVASGDIGVGNRQDDPFREGDTVVAIEVLDTGPGISDENIEKIFEPFFTTKASSGGTGLGLSIVKNIVDLHRGSFYIENNPEGGAKAVIMLKA